MKFQTLDFCTSFLPDHKKSQHLASVSHSLPKSYSFDVCRVVDVRAFCLWPEIELFKSENKYGEFRDFKKFLGNHFCSCHIESFSSIPFLTPSGFQLRPHQLVNLPNFKDKLAFIISIPSEQRTTSSFSKSFLHRKDARRPCKSLQKANATIQPQFWFPHTLSNTSRCRNHTNGRCFQNGSECDAGTCARR